jgi:CHAD domain-containing protein
MRSAVPTAAATLEPRAGQFLTELKKVRKDSSDIEAIHDARVAARRLLAAGDLWAGDAEGWKDLERRLPKLIRRLGRVRNLDVTIEIVLGEKGIPRAERLALERALKKFRRKERARLSRWLTKSRLRALGKDVRDLSKDVRRRLHHIRPRPEELGAYFVRIGHLAQKAQKSHDREEAHEVRRELRRLRYAHETMHWAFPEDEFVRAAKLFRQVQDIAGRWRDLCILEEYAQVLRKKKRPAPLLNGMMTRVRSEAKALSAKFLQSIPDVVSLRPRLLSRVEP